MSGTVTRPIKIAIIGGGLIGPRHAASVRTLQNVELIALVDPAPHGATLASSLGTTHYTSLGDLLSAPVKPDGIVICTPNSTHIALALQCIEAGIPILVEKPVATTITSGISLIEKAKSKNVSVLVGHHRRFNPYLIATKRHLVTGKLGKIIAVQGSWSLLKPSSYFVDAGSWRQSREHGGVIYINLVHDIDLLQFLLGPIVAVAAFEAASTRGYKAEEGAAIILRFESGTVGTFLLSDSTPSPWAFEVGTGENPLISKVQEKDEDRTGGFWRILGTKESLSIGDLSTWSYHDDVEKNGRDKGWGDKLSRTEVEVDTSVVPLDEQMKHFVKVVRGEEEPLCSGQEALSALIACEAVKRAMESGKQMRIVGFEIVEGP